MPALEQLRFQNTFHRLGKDFYTALSPQPIRQPRLVSASESVAGLIGLEGEELRRREFVEVFSGQKLLPAMEPLAMVYSGHQFGVYNPRLGDGRAILLGEVEGPRGRYDLNLKGAGLTPYSRFGDGRAVLRSSIREYLCSEAMYGLGIPTTRALCVIAGEDEIMRETVEPSAVVCRVAPTHLRFGNFEWFYYQNDHANLKKLADYVIEQHFTEHKNKTEKYALFFQSVVQRTARLMAQWQAVGFAHGVMNTDNMSIIGLTFDYGPFGFLDDFEPGFICNHSDHSGRYAFNQQPPIGLWNLNALAHVLTPLVDKGELIDILKTYENIFGEHYQHLLAGKLGLQGDQAGDLQLIQEWLDLMAQNRVDYTIVHRRLAQTRLSEKNNPLRDHFADTQSLDRWFVRYRQRLEQQPVTDVERAERMNAVNPKYILRNYLAQRAIERAHRGDYSEVNTLLQLLYKPFEEQPAFESYADAPPAWGKHLEISCSS